MVRTAPCSSLALETQESPPKALGTICGGLSGATYTSAQGLWGISVGSGAFTVEYLTMKPQE